MENTEKCDNSGKVPPIQLLFQNMEFLEQFAANVVDYTSKYNNISSISYAPENITGKPVKYPYYGDFPDTYMLRSYGKWWQRSEAAQKNYMPHDVEKIVSEDYIILRFEEPVVPTTVIIYETYNPGAVVRIWGRNTPSPSKWYLLYEGEPERCPKTSRKFCPPLNPVNDIIKELRIDFNQSLLRYHTSLDAVLMAGYKPKSDLQLFLLRKGLLDVSIPRSVKRRQSNCSLDDMEEDDSFAVLPYEVIVHIFQYLDLTSISRCAQVSKRWREATLDSVIYQELSLKKYWVNVDNNTLKLLKTRCKILKKLDLSWCGNNHQITEDVFQDFLKKCGTHLTHLSACNCDFIKNVAIGHISKCTELKDLRLRNCFPSPWTFTFFGNLTKLVALDLYSSTIADDSLIKILKSNRNLKHLILDFCEQLENLDEVTETIAIFNQNLLTFSCWKTRSLSADGVKKLARCSQLRELDVGWVLFISEPGDSLERIAQGCPDLRRLILSNWRGLSDHLLLPIIRSCKQLTQLDLMGIKNITGDICERALASLPKLELLEVSFCDSIKEDQVENWREMYPNVTIQRSCESTITDDWNLSE